jgi:hypothetical protein
MSFTPFKKRTKGTCMPFFVGLEAGPLGLDSGFINKDSYLFLKILIKIHVNNIILLITI